MLVLTRKHQEKIRIGDNITITILKTKGKAVRVGIEAPTNIAVVRGELAAAGESIQNAVNAEISAEVPANNRQLRSRTAPAPPSWTASRPSGTKSSAHRQSAVEVSLQRVPRKEASQILPRLVGEGGPLRSMVERRATV